MSRNSFRRTTVYAGGFLLYLFAAVIATYPLVTNLSTAALEGGDTLQVAWLQAWNTEHLFAAPEAAFAANVMYPVPLPLTNIEHMLGLLPVSAPLYWLTGNALLTYNLAMLLGYSLTGFGMFLLVYSLFPRISASYGIALLAGLLFAFSPWRLFRFHHLEQLSVYWLLFGLLCLIHFLKSRRPLLLLGAVIFITLQTLTSYYYVPICAILVGGAFLYMLLTRQASLKLVTATGLVLCGVLLIAHWPLADVYIRNRASSLMPLDEQHAFSILSLKDFISGRQSASLRQLLLGSAAEVVPTMERYVDAGVVAYILVLVSVLGLYRSSRKYKLAWLTSVLVVLASLALSIGPFIEIAGHTLQAPFGWLRSVPGIGSLRAPARLWQAGLLGMTLVGVLGMYALARRAPYRMMNLLLLFLSGVVVVSTFQPERKIIPFSLPAPVFDWIRTTLPSDAVLVHAPLLARQDGFPEVGEAAKTYQSLYHDRMLVNGYLAYIPVEQRLRYLALATFPSAQAMQCLKDTSVTHVLVDRRELSPEAMQSLDGLRSGKGAELKSLYEDADYTVLEVTGAAEPTSGPITWQWAGDWHELEWDGTSWWRWSSGPGSITLHGHPDQTLEFTTELGIVASAVDLTIYDKQGEIWREEYTQGFYSLGPIPVHIGANGIAVLRFVLDQPPRQVGADPRWLYVGIGRAALDGVPISVCQFR
jgi:hypothetical protein